MIQAVIFDCLGVLCLPSGRRDTAVIALARSLRTTHKTALLSNISRSFIQQAFDSQELEALFDIVVLSSEVGIAKPTPEIYEMTATRLGMLPEECVMIDDSEVNIAGARRAGMQGVVFETPQQCQRELQQLLETHHA